MLKLTKFEKKLKKFKKKHKIGLALSGGGTRGFCYIGAFKAFEEYGIEFDAVAGTSAGSLFGAMYASLLKYQDMYKYASNIKDKDFRQSKLGFLPSKMDNLASKIREVIPYKKIEEFPIQFYCVAVNVRDGEEVWFDGGDIVPAITGSCAIPGVYVPVKYKNMVLVDGGVANNLPADILRAKGCDIIIGIDCNSTRGGGTKSNNMLVQFLSTMGIMMKNSTSKGSKYCSVLIKPNTAQFNSLKVAGMDEMIKEGYRATIEAMPEIVAIIEGKQKRFYVRQNKLKKSKEKDNH